MIVLPDSVLFASEAVCIFRQVGSVVGSDFHFTASIES
jgi:hypothetical protein